MFKGFGKMTKNRIFIFEYISGGGFNKMAIPLSLFSEGFGMLKVSIQDFKSLGFEVKTILDYRISSLASQLDCDIMKEITGKMDFTPEFKKSIVDCEYVFIIAPEFSGILYNLTQIAKRMGKKLLSMDLEPILQGSSKTKTYNLFTRFSIPTPHTFYFKKNDGTVKVEQALKHSGLLKTPLIVKPDDGVGAESIYYFETREQFDNFITNEMDLLDPNRDYIVQEFISGSDLSASIIKREKEPPIILAINAQNIILEENEIKYIGGITPAENAGDIKYIIESYLNNLDLTQFKGFFGIDFIKKLDHSLSFIEINPRLTTSYIGVRNITKNNPFLLLIYPEVDPSEILDPNSKWISEFFHLNLKYTGDEKDLSLGNEISEKIPQIIVPPLPLNPSISNVKEFTCFAATKAESLKSARKQKKKIIKDLEKFNFHSFI
ncbi:MAG: ATP-grasp domain-containing protein [Promethearchaeota archaeon]|nr:MAG: ATP-grasp domain-containing protein [Candidatus Lokiarchaeota archaeon]